MMQHDVLVKVCGQAAWSMSVLRSLGGVGTLDLMPKAVEQG